MKATKYTLTVTVEVLSLQSVRALLCEIGDMVEEAPHGLIGKEDGDTIAWDTSREEVEI